MYFFIISTAGEAVDICLHAIRSLNCSTLLHANRWTKSAINRSHDPDLNRVVDYISVKYTLR